MPANVVKSYADKLGKSVSELDDKWKKAESIAKEKMSDENKRNKGYDPEKDDSYYPYVMGIFKNMFSKEDKSKLKLEAIMYVYNALFETAEYEVNHRSGKSRYKTSIAPEKRSLKNIPKDSKGNSKVRFQEWLNIKKPTEYSDMAGYDASWGKGSDGKYYGWSHRAVHGFAVGDKVKTDTIGNWKNNEWAIGSDKDAAKMAIEFAKDVA